MEKLILRDVSKEMMPKNPLAQMREPDEGTSKSTGHDKKESFTSYPDPPNDKWLE